MTDSYIEIASEDTELENFAVSILQAAESVSSADARKFLGAIMQRKLSFNGIKVPLENFDVLPMKNKLALYHAVAKEDHPDRYDLLVRMNQSFSLFKNFDEIYDFLAKQHAEKFFGDTERIESLWKAAGHNACSFGNTMHHFINAPADASYVEKKDICNFLASEYAAANNLAPHQILFYRGKKADGGATWRLRDVVGINTRGRDFIEEPHKLPAMIAHEIEHKLQMGIALSFMVGKIPNTPDTELAYNFAWIMCANLFTRFGYLNAVDATEKNWMPAVHYMEQPSERGARATEEYVEKLILKNWQHNPNP